MDETYPALNTSRGKSSIFLRMSDPTVPCFTPDLWALDGTKLSCRTRSLLSHADAYELAITALAAPGFVDFDLQSDRPRSLDQVADSVYPPPLGSAQALTTR